MMRCTFLAVAAALALPAPASPEAVETVTIAVRKDARPFAWQATESLGTFRGYLVDLCIDATTRAGFRFNLKAIDAS